MAFRFFLKIKEILIYISILSIVIVVCFFLLFSKQGNLATEKKSIPVDSVLATQLFGQADTLFEQVKFDSSIYYYEKAGKIYKDLKDHENSIKCEIRIGKVFIEKGITLKALKHLEETLQTGLQYFDENELIIANIYDAIGLAYENSCNYPAAIQFFQKGLQIKLTLLGEQNDDIIYTYNRLGFNYSNLIDHQNAFHFLYKALQIGKKIHGNNHQTVFDTYLTLIYAYTLHQNEINKSIEYYNEAHKIRNSVNYNKLRELYFWVGNIYLTKNDFTQSIPFYQKALGLELKGVDENDILDALIYEKLSFIHLRSGKISLAFEYVNKSLSIYRSLVGNENRYVAQSYTMLGILNYTLGNFNQAFEFFNKSYKICLKTLSEFQKTTIINEIFLGYIYKRKGDINKAEEYFKKALQKNMNIFGEKRNNTANPFNNLGLIYLQKGDLKQALEYLNQALKIRLKTCLKSSFSIGSNYANIGLVYQKMGDYKNAIKYLNKALENGINGVGEKSQEVAKVYERFGNVYSDIKDYPKALFYYHKALQSEINEFNNDNIYSNPELQEKHANLYLLSFLKQKASTLFHYYSNISKNIKDLNCSLHTFELAVNVVDDLLRTYKREDSRLYLVRESYDIYDQALNTTTQLYKLTGKQIYKEKAFRFAEKNKATVLHQMLTESKAQQTTVLEDSLLQQEQYLKEECDYYEYSIYEENDKGANMDTVKINQWQNKLFNLREQYSNLIKYYEENYPEYAKHITVNDILTCSDIQEKMTDDHSMLLEYFLGEKYLYIFSITKDSVDLIKTHHDSLLYKQIQSFRIALIERDKTNYNQLAYELYESLIKPVKNNPKIKKLIIVPDGILGYIPFEVLLTKKITNNTDFKNYPYLIKDYQISYSYSSTLLFEDSKIKNINRETDFVGFAPVTFK